MKMRLLVLAILLGCKGLMAQSPDSVSVAGGKRFPPFCDETSKRYILRNEQAKFGRKFLRAQWQAMGLDALSMSLLFVMPRELSNWSVPQAGLVRVQYRRSFTRLPVFDSDVWYINYIGHPYQGACYYNAMRSQGAKFWQAGLFALGNSLVWEYVGEGGMEQPSVQDLVVTPFVGSLLGELIHHGTVQLSRNGFKWYEKVFVCLFNPMFAINNGFNYAKKPCQL